MSLPTVPLQRSVPLDEVTTPVPVPVFVTVSRYVMTGATLNVAITAMFALIVTVHRLSITRLQPLQPANVESGSASAVSVTTVSES
ncbi:hypothetical protein MBAV_004811 [Candidatus Magnetobacterium bavaricum]|uniref:Uncharacterized protein n=1 Tax=Candidatus Magnetobacterium bavaricum TaxID=29290 RepID=A0A0F3GQQ1_9BACT|nr:hypothetical protein MBAV_004811 [Candidatus Magnetobacterium bavaricum]